MNAKDRAVLVKIYDTVNTITGLTPNNPADQRAKIAFHQTILHASRPLLLAISALGFGDYEDAHEYADEAALLIQQVDLPPRRSVTGGGHGD